MSKLEADKSILTSLISQTRLVRQRADLELADAALRRERAFQSELERIEAKIAAEVAEAAHPTLALA